MADVSRQQDQNWHRMLPELYLMSQFVHARSHINYNGWPCECRLEAAPSCCSKWRVVLKSWWFWEENLCGYHIISYGMLQGFKRHRPEFGAEGQADVMLLAADAPSCASLIYGKCLQTMRMQPLKQVLTGHLKILWQPPFRSPMLKGPAV